MHDVAEQEAQPRAANALHSVVMDDMSKTFSGRTVLSGIELTVRAGERVALIGPSGSGKTTILRLLMGLDKPDSGTIKIDGRYLWHERVNGELRLAGERNVRHVRRAVGMVFQQFNLFPHLTALQNVAEPLEQVVKLPRAKASQAATELLICVGLEEYLQHKPDQMSGGQQQRVAIARSLALGPKVMLFDEITSALDPERVGEVLHVVRDLARVSRISMLIVTHEIQFACDIADRVLMWYFPRGKLSSPQLTRWSRNNTRQR